MFSRKKDSLMTPAQKALIIYVEATASARAAIVDRLRAKGFTVQEVLVTDADAEALRPGEGHPDLRAMIEDADLCIFLLPEDGVGDGGLAGAATEVSGFNKPLVAILQGDREDLPDVFEDCAAAVIRETSDQLDRVLAGEEVWETRNAKPRPDRTITHVKCQ